MPLAEIGAVLLVLIVVFMVGQIWFHLVESVLGRIKRMLTCRKEPPAWHPLPPDHKDDPDA